MVHKYITPNQARSFRLNIPINVFCVRKRWLTIREPRPGTKQEYIRGRQLHSKLVTLPLFTFTRATLVAVNENERKARYLAPIKKKKERNSKAEEENYEQTKKRIPLRQRALLYYYYNFIIFFFFEKIQHLRRKK